MSPDLALPTDVVAPPDPYAQRAEDQRQKLVEEMGGSEATERAVALALQWLANHQSADGRWDADGFDHRCNQCGGHGKYDADVAATGLALLCFLGADHTHVKEGPYRAKVQQAIDWLLSQQSGHGDLRRSAEPRRSGRPARTIETMYSHGIAAIALSEAYGMTKDEKLRAPVQRAIDFIIEARNTSLGGWRYEPGQPGDTSVLGWQVMAMVSASRAGLAIPEAALEAARQWLDLVSRPDARGLYAYQPGQPPSAAMTAEGMFAQQLLGRTRDHERMKTSAAFVMRHSPRWPGDDPGAIDSSVRSERGGPRAPQDGPIDDDAGGSEGVHTTYYWYYATLALFQHGGEEWKQWNAALTAELLAHQRIEGSLAGSWDPADRWSRIGGRVYQTAMCTLSLEVYYRYLPLYGRD